MAIKELGFAGVSSGWRQKVADRVAPRVAKRTPASSGAIRAAIGLGFLVLSALYVVRSVREALRG